MNFLTFIFSLLLILSFGTFAMLEKQSGDRRIRSTYLGHLKANRKILAKTEAESFSRFRSIPQPATPKRKSQKEKKKRIPKAPPINPECARLNLWPLIQEGREKHPLLYETTAHLFKTFYGAALFNKPRFEYRFLDLFLKRAKEALQKEPSFALEKLSLNDSSLQMLYYKMLKGTKEKNLEQQIGYPSLLDSIRIEPFPSKICLSHAHPDQIAVFFGFKVAAKFYREIHQEKPPLLTRELIEKICSECHVTILDPEIFEWFLFGRPNHSRFSKTTFIEMDKETHISLRKNVYLPKFPLVP